MKEKISIVFVILMFAAFVALFVSYFEQTYTIDSVKEVKVVRSAPIVITNITAEGEKDLGAVSILEGIAEDRIKNDMGDLDFKITFNNGETKSIYSKSLDNFPYRIGDEYIREVEGIYYEVTASDSGDKVNVSTTDDISNTKEMKLGELISLPSYTPKDEWRHHGNPTELTIEYKVRYRNGLAHKSKEFSFNVSL